MHLGLGPSDTRLNSILQCFSASFNDAWSAAFTPLDNNTFSFYKFINTNNLEKLTIIFMKVSNATIFMYYYYFHREIP